MAIEILERGEAPSERIYQINCHYCRSKLQFDRKDAEFVSDRRDGDYLRIKCPVCLHDLTVTAHLRGDIG